MGLHFELLRFPILESVLMIQREELHANGYCVQMQYINKSLQFFMKISKYFLTDKKTHRSIIHQHTSLDLYCSTCKTTMARIFRCILLLLSYSKTFCKYVHIDGKMLWLEAQSYCRKNDTWPLPNMNMTSANFRSSAMSVSKSGQDWKGAPLTNDFGQEEGRCPSFSGHQINLKIEQMKITAVLIKRNGMTLKEHPFPPSSAMVVSEVQKC